MCKTCPLVHTLNQCNFAENVPLFCKDMNEVCFLFLCEYRPTLNPFLFRFGFLNGRTLFLIFFAVHQQNMIPTPHYQYPWSGSRSQSSRDWYRYDCTCWCMAFALWLQVASTGAGHVSIVLVIMLHLVFSSRTPFPIPCTVPFRLLFVSVSPFVPDVAIHTEHYALKFEAHRWSHGHG